jgi:DNA-directed RNA polymerase subunit K/omega
LKMSQPVLSKYERVAIIAARVEQLLGGAPPMIEGADRGAEETAEEELRRGLLVLRIARKHPNGQVRVYDIKSFIIPS